jgi:ABC-type glycerol-3-phosphate transport system substrate-binding protein
VQRRWRKLLVDGLVVLGIAVNVGLLLINLRPERPHLAPRTKARVLLRASDPRIQWMRDNEFAEFAAANDIDFELVGAKTFEDVHQKLTDEKQHPTGLLLADVDDEHAQELKDTGLVRPIANGANFEELRSALSEFIPDAVSRGAVDGKQWYLPKRALVNVAVYLRPAIEDAYLHWEEDRKQIDAALKEANGVGLPSDFRLRRSPDRWDSFDLFVAAWTWAHHPARWAEASRTISADNAVAPGIAPRVAWPCGDSEDAAGELLNALYRHGMREEQLGRFDAPALLDTLQWQVLFRKHGLVPAKCEESGLEQFDVTGLLHQRKLAWAPIDQPDSLWLHGGARRDAPAGIPGPNDLSWATLPQGASVELHDGHPARRGRSFAFEEVHLWAVPIHSPDPRLAFRVAHFLGQRGLQQREAEAEGMLPVREDLRRDYPVAFRLEWMQRMLDASFRQLERGSGDLPAAWDDWDDKYLKVRQSVVYGRPKNAKVTLAAIRESVQHATRELPAEAAHDAR